MSIYSHLDTGLYGQTISAMRINLLIVEVQLYNGVALMHNVLKSCGISRVFIITLKFASNQFH